MNLDRFFQLELPQGKIALTWFNSYSGIALRTPKAILIFDPAKMGERRGIRADAIIITHEHYDHFDPKSAIELQRQIQAIILTTPFVARSLLNNRVKALSVGDSFTIKEVKLYAEHCEHPAKQPLSFIIEAEGVTLYHPSDSDPFPEMIRLKEKYKPELLLYWGTSFKNAAEIARLICPRIIISYDDNSGSPQRPEAINREALGTEVQTLKQFEVYQYPP